MGDHEVPCDAGRDIGRNPDPFYFAVIEDVGSDHGQDDAADDWFEDPEFRGDCDHQYRPKNGEPTGDAESFTDEREVEVMTSAEPDHKGEESFVGGLKEKCGEQREHERLQHQRIGKTAVSALLSLGCGIVGEKLQHDQGRDIEHDHGDEQDARSKFWYEQRQNHDSDSAGECLDEQQHAEGTVGRYGAGDDGKTQADQHASNKAMHESSAHQDVWIPDEHGQ